MADDPRYRSQRSDRHSQDQPSVPGDDPLAELARLIGQDEAFRTAGRQGVRGGRLEAPAAAAQARREESMSVGQPTGHPDFEPRSSRRSRGPAERWPDESDFRDPLVEAGAYGSREDDAAYSGRGHGEADYEQDRESDPYRTAAYDGRYEPREYEGREYQEYADGDAAEPQMAAEYDGDLYARDEEDYEDVVQPRRRSGMLTVAAVLGLVVLGTALAFGYRAWNGSAGSAGPPPVIKADTGPSKVVPAPSGDAQQNKMIYDRIGEKIQSSPDRTVSREEQPLELKEMSRAPSPRGVMPNATPGTVMIGAQPPAPATAPAPGGNVGPNEPKKVHTITIRPDQPNSLPDSGEAAGSPPAYSAAAPLAMPAPAQAAPARPSAGSASRSAPSRSTSPAKPAAKSDGNAPLTINTQENAADAAESPAPPSRASTGAHPVRTAALPSGAAAGGYVVQVSSQRSEAEAQSSFRSLQAKYPSVLGSRQPIVRRADLGTKGIYYRAQVGPFATADEANEVCSSLKAAGGQCIIQRN